MEKKEERIEQVYIQVYFWFLLIFQTLIVTYSPEPDTRKGAADAVFIYLSCIPLYGYAYDKKIAPQLLWKLFVPAFYIWQIIFFLYLYNDPMIYKNSVTLNAMFLIMRCPLYWSVANFALITMEADENKRMARTEKRNKFKEKARSFVVILSALALLLLVLCLFIMVRQII